MADLDDIKDGKDWGIDLPARNTAFFLKGSEQRKKAIFKASLYGLFIVLIAYLLPRL